MEPHNVSLNTRHSLPRGVDDDVDDPSDEGSRGGRFPVRCPACGGDVVDGIHVDLRTNYFCERCSACWHVRSDSLQRVNPTTCGAGCEHFERCTLAYAKDAAHRTDSARSAYADQEDDDPGSG